MNLKNLLSFILHFLSPRCSKKDLLTFFNRLTRMKYEAHPDYNIRPDKIFDYPSSDCEDRSLALAYYMRKQGCKNIKLLRLSWNTPINSFGHLAVLLDGKVWDATAKNEKGEYIFFDYPYESYLKTFNFHQIIIEHYY